MIGAMLVMLLAPLCAVAQVSKASVAPSGALVANRDTEADLARLSESVDRSVLQSTAESVIPQAAPVVTPKGSANNNPKVSWLWHMHQPIYWNDQLRAGGTDRYEYAWESIQQKDGGSSSPENNLREIFGKDDRVAAYQYRTRDAVGSIGGHANGGVAISYSGALMENVNSLGQAGQLGYGSGWAGSMNEAHGWTTTDGKTKMDIVNFTYHHSLIGLHNPETVYMELKLQQEKMKEVFGGSYNSNGLFPTEMCFSERLIPTLVDLGIDWSIVSGEHIARACPDFPVQFGSGGINCQPPNLADQINPNGVDFIRVSIDRGCSPTNANPLSYQPAYAKYVDPETGAVDQIIVVPADQSQGWRDGYACINANFIDGLNAKNNPSLPSLTLMAHDGDNAFGGGFSYYGECVPGLAGDAVSRGGEVTTIEQYLDDYAANISTTIHVEDGGWAYADGDFGSPSFINWNYPLLDVNGQHDPANGWHEKAREMALFTETLNRVLTAQQVTGNVPNFQKIMHPDGSTTAVDRGWHYFLGSLDSGNVYYGTPLDLEIKGTIGCNEAFEHVDPIVAANLNNDLTPPTIWLPQRFPYNPGSINFGVEHQYTQYQDDGDFHIWTFIADVNSLSRVQLKYRIDVDGTNPIASHQNETFAGGAEVGAWQTLTMNGRQFPNGNVYNKPDLNYFELPAHMPYHYSVEVVDLREVLIDYYIEAEDSKGNIAKSPIQHVWIGDGNGAAGDTVTTVPDPMVKGSQATITYDPTGRVLSGASDVFIHIGYNDWTNVESPDPQMTPDGNGKFTYTFTVDPSATVVDCVFNNGSGTWDNNGGNDWHLTTTDPAGPPVAAFTSNTTTGYAPLTVNFTDQSTNSPSSWAWDFDNDGSTDSTSQNPSHQFSSVGIYTVKLTATNGEGSDDEIKVDYITVTEAPTDPEISLNKANINANGVLGQDAPATDFTVTNSAFGTLNYSIAIPGPGVTEQQIKDFILGNTSDGTGLDLNGDSVVDAADIVYHQLNGGGGTVPWLSINPTSGSSTGEADTIAVVFDSDALPVDTYEADIVVTGNAPNSPQSIHVTLIVSDAIPTQTTVVPNPPVQGQGARVWYNRNGGPLASASTIILHWGINGGLDGNDTWEDVVDEAMTQSVNPDMWYRDITIDPTATTLNFVTNNGAGTWDNNNNNDWNFEVVPDIGDPAVIGLNKATLSPSATVGSNPPADTFTITNTGGGTLNYSVSFTDTTPAPVMEKGVSDKGTGSFKTITIDGLNTSSEWTADNLIATDPAFDNANVSGGNWSTHETQMDYTALFAAWDANNLYVGIQICDVIDVEDPANAGSSAGTKPAQFDLPQFIGIDVNAGGYGVDLVNGDMWVKGHGFAGSNLPDYQVYFASNFFQGPFVCPYNAGWDPDNDAYGPTGQIYIDHAGLDGASAVHYAGVAPITGVAPGNKDYIALGHDTNRDSFFEVAIPLELIGSPNLSTNGISLFVSHGAGNLFSGVDSIPNDPATTDTPGVSDSNSPNEWEDYDTYNAAFAQVGNGGPQPTPWLSVSPTSGSSTGEADTINVTYDTTGLAQGTYTGTINVTGNTANSPQTIDVTMTLNGGGTDPVISLNKTVINKSVVEGNDASADSFTVTNSGAATLNYTIAKTDTGDGTAWFDVNPTAGDSTGEADTINVTFSTAGLAADTYSADVTVSGNGTNSPQTLTINLTVNSNSVPTETTVVPNPAIAGQTARVWYKETGGPIAGAAQYNLHWGINTWTGVTDSPMTESATSGMWYADIAVPGNATVLDFVTNDGNNNWDNNGGADWHFTVVTSPDPVIAVSTTSVSQSTSVGVNPGNKTFSVSNSGSSTLNYSLVKTDTGDGTSWFNISPTSGSSTGEADTITITYNAAALSAATYNAEITVSGNSANSPVTVDVSLIVGSGPVVGPITIGAGPVLGTNTEGTTYNEELRDWDKSDVRGLDPDDAISLGDGYDMSRDIAALYSRFEGDNLYLRVDVFELGIFAENTALDTYVLIDCAAGGTTSMPNGISGNSTRQWDLAVASYDGTNGAAIKADGSTIANAFLGSYYRSDLDGYEFGVKKSALMTVGWDGSSEVFFNVITVKDGQTQIADSINLGGGMGSNGVTGTAKFASIAHGNQSLNRGDSMRERIYISGANTGTGAPSGFRMTLDTHTIFQIPLNIHMSGTLISAIGWIKDANPVHDGQTFLGIVGSVIDADQSTDPGSLVGGVFSEHIMPFFNGPINQNSIVEFDALTTDIWGIDGDDMKVMHIPERVTNSVASGNGLDPFDDIVASKYVASYIDEVGHIRDWLYPGDSWTGIGGVYGIPRQHKIHMINGVYCFQINDQEDQYKFWPQDGGANMNWRQNLLYKAMDTDQEQLTLIFDDWEAMAGYSFGSGYNDNALNYNATMRWVANHPWIEVVNLSDILDRATNSGNPQYSANWIVNQGDIGDKGFNTYDYLHHATEDSYANWYWGSGQEQSFRNAIPTTSGNIGSGTQMPSGKVFGDIGTGGTIIKDTWDAISAAPQNNLRTLAQKAYQAMIYETAWHDEDNTDYTRNAGNNYHGWQNPDGSYDNVSGWAFTLQNHIRDITVTTKAADWVDSLKQGTRPAGVSVSSIDLDQDGENEFVISNEFIWMAFEARGGRCVQGYYYDAAIQDGISFLGTSPINNPSNQGEEEGTSTASRCSGFKDMNTGAFADAIYGVSTGASSLTFTSGSISKTISLTSGSKTITASYNNGLGADLYTRMGISVNNLDLLPNGQNFVSTYNATTFTQTNNTRGSVTITANNNSGINQLDTATKFVIPLTEQMEVRCGTGSSSFTITVP